MTLNIALRVDASVQMGTGHVMRCLTLADALAARGARCRFIHREHPGHMADAIRTRGHGVSLLKPAEAAIEAGATGDYACWLGVPLEEDAEQTIRMLDPEPLDWLIVDHYAIDTAWHSQLRPYARFIAAIDDIANRPHDTDLLIDQNYSTEGAARYDGLVRDSATRLCGPQWALLHPAYAEHRTAAYERKPRFETVFVFFGGADPDNWSGRVLEALSTPELAQLHVDLVLGTSNPNRSALESQAARRGLVTLHRPQPHLASLMANADLAIGAGGATTWERCCIGLPSVVISIAENQRPTCEALASANTIRYLGHHDQVTKSTITNGIQSLLADTDSRKLMAQNGMEMVDGLGAKRVADYMFTTALTSEKLAACR